MSYYYSCLKCQKQCWNNIPKKLDICKKCIKVVKNEKHLEQFKGCFFEKSKMSNYK